MSPRARDAPTTRESAAGDGSRSILRAHAPPLLRSDPPQQPERDYSYARNGSRPCETNSCTDGRADCAFAHSVIRAGS